MNHIYIYIYIYRYIHILQYRKPGKACSLDHQPSAKAQAKSTRALATKLGIARFRLRRYLKIYGFLKTGVPLAGVPIIRIIEYWGLYGGPPT